MRNAREKQKETSPRDFSTRTKTIFTKHVTNATKEQVHQLFDE